MKTIIGILVTIMMFVGIMLFLNTALKLEWTTYLGIPLIVFAGSAGTAFVTKRFEAIIGGVILGALWPIICNMALSCP